MLKSVIQILFSNECEVEGQKGMEKRGEGDRSIRRSSPSLDPAVSCWSFFIRGFSVVEVSEVLWNLSLFIRFSKQGINAHGLDSSLMQPVK